MPGPNDFHVQLVETETEDGKKVKVPTIHPGLDKDEPSEARRLGAKKAADAEISRLKAEIMAEAEELDLRTGTLDSREQELNERERLLAAREAAMAGGSTKPK